jgi:hypothetical protein
MRENEALLTSLAFLLLCTDTGPSRNRSLGRDVMASREKASPASLARKGLPSTCSDENEEENHGLNLLTGCKYLSGLKTGIKVVLIFSFSAWEGSATLSAMTHAMNAADTLLEGSNPNTDIRSIPLV